jgi:hypothetical protein
MATHELKTWPVPFAAMLEGRKMYELRPCEDREFAVGDELILREWQPAHEEACSWQSPFDEQQTEQSDFFCTKCNRKKKEPLPGNYTGRDFHVEVTYVTLPGKFGLPANLCAMSVQPLKSRKKRSVLQCDDCSAEFVEFYPGAARQVGWESYRESNGEGQSSPLITVCPRCQEKPFKLRFFKRTTPA